MSDTFKAAYLSFITGRLNDTDVTITWNRTPVGAPVSGKTDVVLYYAPGGEREDTHSGMSGEESRRIQFSIFSVDPQDVANVSKALHAIVDGARGTLSDGTTVQSSVPGIQDIDSFDSDEQVFQTVFDVEVHLGASSSLSVIDETPDQTTKDYVDAGDASTLAAAEAYTDSHAGASAWDDITGKPSTFPPTLPITESGVSGLVSDLNTLASAITSEASSRAAAVTAAITTAEAYADAAVAVETAARASAITSEASARTTGDSTTLSTAEGYTDTAVATEASARSTADGLLVPKTTTVNGHALSGNVTVAEADISGLVSDLAGKVPVTRTVNGHDLTADVTIAQADISGLVSALAGKVPTTRTVNGKDLSADITLAESDIANLTSDLAGKVPTTRTVNGKALSSDITLAESDIANLTSDLSLKAPLASPALTGTPTAPTATDNDNSTKLATTAYADKCVASVITANQGGLVLPACDGSWAWLLDNATAGFPTGNVVRAQYFVLASRLKISKMVLDLSAGSGTAGSHAYVGIYAAGGATKLVEGKFAADSATVQSVTPTGGAVTLEPGVYILAFGADSASGTVTCRAGLASLASFVSLINADSVQQGTAANAISSGALPSSIGVISALAISVPVVYAHP